MLDGPHTKTPRAAPSGSAVFQPAPAIADIEAGLDALSAPAGAGGALDAAMRHALLAPGKRLRPLLVLLLAGQGRAARDAACAVEMVHAASLILDDLPCMDDAVLRRGRETTHRRFGEATATLAAVALIARAFEVLAALPVAAELRADLTATLSKAIGRDGMAGGQDLDVAGSAESEEVNALKTASLFVAAARMGGRLAGMTPERATQIDLFAWHFGAAFQIADDGLDAGRPEETGKDAGRDAGKPTLAAAIGRSEAWAVQLQHTLRARAALRRAGLEERLGAVLALVEAGIPR